MRVCDLDYVLEVLKKHNVRQITSPNFNVLMNPDLKISTETKKDPIIQPPLSERDKRINERMQDLNNPYNMS